MSSQTFGRQEVVLIVEDDAALCLGLLRTLRSAGYKVEIAKTGAEGIFCAISVQPDVVLLDVMMPGMNGFEVCEELRKLDSALPILMLTAKADEADKVRGLKLGADDYIVKPFSIAELLARVDAALRRKRLARAELGKVEFGDVVIDFRAHTATKGKRPIVMTALEMRLMRYFVENEGALLPRQRILDAVWGADYFGTDRTVDNFINRLRSKVEDDGKSPLYIVTVRGAGYRFLRDKVRE